MCTNYNRKFVFKYKQVADALELARTIDIIESKRLYIPSSLELNDPMEGFSYRAVPHYAGCSISVASKDLDPVLEKQYKNFKIESFTETCNSPVMWALYSNNYKGVCFIFQPINQLINLKEVKYENISTSEDQMPGISDEMHDRIFNSFLIKRPDWNYEKEWRLILEKDETPSFIDVSNQVLIGIIIGHQAEPEISKLLYRIARKNDLYVYKTLPKKYAGQVYIVPHDYEYHPSGQDIEADIYKYYIENANIPMPVDPKN